MSEASPPKTPADALIETLRRVVEEIGPLAEAYGKQLVTQAVLESTQRTIDDLWRRLRAIR